MERRELNVRELLELERQIYQESIDRVLKQQEELSSGVLDDFVRRCRPFEEDRERELQVAKNQLQFSQQDALSLLAFDLQQADDVFRTQKTQLKRKLLEKVKRKRAMIEKRLQLRGKTFAKVIGEAVATSSSENEAEFQLSTLDGGATNT
ncbi:hypothetical protein PHMEG_00021404 [Phytophthora megakarya]|uniref:Flagellar FliJ protein n=1 Tax=Phytophthora megakarya TaxID=4795 RepID=A0A225VLX9_9STRA|nr:hypothetical protein PHMEG_00021404 [Phytophthora megakarya]